MHFLKVSNIFFLILKTFSTLKFDFIERVDKGWITKVEADNRSFSP